MSYDPRIILAELFSYNSQDDASILGSGLANTNHCVAVYSSYTAILNYQCVCIVNKGSNVIFSYLRILPKTSLHGNETML